MHSLKGANVTAKFRVCRRQLGSDQNRISPMKSPLLKGHTQMIRRAFLRTNPPIGYEPNLDARIGFLAVEKRG